ncbi:MAG: TonB-dependent receptor [Pseudomonadota bacterium]
MKKTVIAAGSPWLLAFAGAAAQAQGVATEAELDRVIVVAQRSGLAAQLPSSSASKQAQDLRLQNLFNPEDALQYAPNTMVRKRYLGDRNALLAGRSFGTLQPSRALVYLDGYLISNFLGRFDAPRWNMVTPEAISRVDLLYGPYSALYPGNSIGTTVAVTQRQPQGLELSARLAGAQQRYDAYGHAERFDSHQASFHLGHRLPGGLWMSADVNHQNSTSQPMQYFTVSADAAGAFPAVSGTATPVSGVVYDTDPKGFRRAVFGASGGAIDHTVQDTLNLRAGYRFNPVLELSGMAAWWINDTETRNQTFLRNADGRPVWDGVVTDGRERFSIPASAFAPSTRDEQHQQLGLTLKARRDTGWNASLVLSDYRIRQDAARQANQPDPVAAAGGSGTVTRRDGTGWNTAEAQLLWKPAEGDWTGGRHTLALGLHRNAYRLDNTVYTAAADWRSEQGAVEQFYRGRTEVTAAYLQDVWRLADDWQLTLGWREERFRTHDGQQLSRGAYTAYPARRLSGHSPKAAFAWRLSDELLVRLSLGRGVRFPNVEELYNGTVTATAQTLFDPYLRPEVSDAAELSMEREWGTQRLRVSLFHDTVHDAIVRQNVVVGPRTQTMVFNVDRVGSRGLEIAWSIQRLFVEGLSLDANAAFTRARITANTRDPASVGKRWLRVPRTRATLLAAYRFAQDWTASAGWRHEGRAWNDVYNSDIHPDRYGAVSRLNQLDLRLAWKMSRQLEWALGVNNATDRAAFQHHPYPGRTAFAELRFSR